MNSTISKNVIFILLFTIALIYGCTKDEDTLTGTLIISFANPPADISVWINPAENTDIWIGHDLIPDAQGNLSRELNMGNYIVNCYSNEQSFSTDLGFQIMPGRTTKINYTSGGVGEIIE